MHEFTRQDRQDTELSSVSPRPAGDPEYTEPSALPESTRCARRLTSTPLDCMCIHPHISYLPSTLTMTMMHSCSLRAALSVCNMVFYS